MTSKHTPGPWISTDSTGEGANIPGGTVGSTLTLAKETARAAIAKARGEGK